MSVNDGFALFSIIVFTLLNSFFTLAEIALVTVRNVRLQQMIAEGGAQAGAAAEIADLMRKPTRVVATVQVGITLASFAVAAIAATTLGPDLAKWLHSWGLPHPVRWAVALLTFAFALFTIAVGEIVPRSIALREPERVALAVAAPLGFFMSLFSPLASIALTVSNAIVRPFGLTATFAAPVLTEEELRTLLEAGAQSGAIEEEEKEIIRNVISFGDTDVRQVMTPRTEMRAADLQTPLADLVALIVESGHSRIPLYEGTVDMIVGIVHAKDLLPIFARGETKVALRGVMRAPLLVPENRAVGELLEQFRRSKTQLAIVQDEYGGTAGLVTIEDLLEEIVGEITDEYDVEEPETDRPLILTDGDGSAVVDGRVIIDDLNEQMGLTLPNEDFDTVGGLVFGLFGRQPAAGECIQHEGLDFVVTKTDGRRVQEIRLCPHPPDEAETETKG